MRVRNSLCASFALPPSPKILERTFSWGPRTQWTKTSMDCLILERPVNVNHAFLIRRTPFVEELLAASGVLCVVCSGSLIASPKKRNANGTATKSANPWLVTAFWQLLLLCFCLDVRLCAEIAPVTQNVEMIFCLWGTLDDFFFLGHWLSKFRAISVCGYPFYFGKFFEPFEDLHHSFDDVFWKIWPSSVLRVWRSFWYLFLVCLKFTQLRLYFKCWTVVALF